MTLTMVKHAINKMPSYSHSVESNVFLTKKHQQTHADGQDGAGAEGGQEVTFHLPDLTVLTPEPGLAAAAEGVRGQGRADPTVAARGR